MYMNAAINESPTIVGAADAAMTDPGMLAVKFNSDGEVVLAGAGEVAVGVILPCESGVAAGDDVTIQIRGITLWTAGAAVAKGAIVASDANGKAITAAASKYIVGIALEAASAAGKVIPVLLTHSGYVPAA